MSQPERVQYLLFVINTFQSLEHEMVRKLGKAPKPSYFRRNREPMQTGLSNLCRTWKGMGLQAFSSFAAIHSSPRMCILQNNRKLSKITGWYA